ncbi:aspartate dehydrogenase [Methanomicrobiaceae archaeon CYW5]|uniref:aspartate dehydrogenase n=1 Tax=Methanovulcanius yangii TaxID=1789227 RepID=UPI0029CA1AFE|nr:aspartate dehydrogenase [Methanovulcanius yangii]MBT8508068.1 aspartate dehydrogenase [Methanovulcanius yangii]
MKKVGLLGCGNVGHIIAERCDGFVVTAVFDVDTRRAEEVANLCGARVYPDFDRFLESDADIIVEAASVAAVREYAQTILTKGKDIVILSVGALADEELRRGIEQLAAATDHRVYIPSGAIVGLDGLKTGEFANITRVVLRTTKNPASLGIATNERMLVFKGTAADCIREFPKNINVAVAIELASGVKAEVELWADPAAIRNIHELTYEGEFGEVTITVRNNPSPDNPATSYLAALSILTLLRNLDRPLQIGT